MKKLIFLILILAAGLTAYPQSSRSSREAKSNKGRSSQVASRSSSKSSSKKVTKSRNQQSRPKATASRSSSSSRSAINRSRGSSRSSAPKATKSRSSSSSNRSGAVKSGRSSSRSSAAARSGNSSSRSSRAQVGTISNSRSGQSASRSSSSQRSSRSAAKSNNNVIQSSNSRKAVPSKIKKSEGSRSQSTVVKSRNNSSSNAVSRANSNSFNRSNRLGNKTYVRNDGREFRHQNDEVFSRNRYRVDYGNTYSLRRSNDFIRVYNNYYNWYNRRYVRRVVIHNRFYHPMSIDIRRIRYPYRVPVHLDLCWTPRLHQSFVYYYPLYNNWNTHYGDYVETLSSYEALDYVGSVNRIYGKVEEVYYSPEDRTYTLYFGAVFPYHDFSVVIPRDIAKRFSWSPSWYFEDEHVWVIGLIEMWEGKPEIVLHDEQQISRY